MCTNIEPKRVFEIFFDICKIPRGSGNCEKIADYCVKFAQSHGLSYKRDAINNVIIYKEGRGEAVCVQAHLDMVCEKLDGKEIDFLSDPIIPVIEGDSIRADGTTLGADNGIGLAFCLALLEENIESPLEILLTSDEEIGLIGANGLDRSWISARKLINLDSEEEGVITVGCASGATAEVTMPLTLTEGEGEWVTLTVSGLAGGHSGVDIAKGRLNAVKVLFDVVSRLGEVRLSAICGGTKDNVIPRKATATFLMTGDTSTLDSAIEMVKTDALKTEQVHIEYTKERENLSATSVEDSAKIVDILNRHPSGVMTMSPDIEGMVERSLNLAIIGMDKGFYAGSMVRSSKNSAAESIFKKIYEVAESNGAKAHHNISFPAWEYRENSRLQAVAEESYEELFGQKAEVQLIHAGLECGVIGDGIDDLESISIGPDLRDVHSTEETLSISSTTRTWKYVLKILENLAK